MLSDNLNLRGVSYTADVELAFSISKFQQGRNEGNALTDLDNDIETMQREPDRVYIPVDQIPNHQPSDVERFASGEVFE